MFIKISTGKEVKPIEVSKKDLIKDLKKLIFEEFEIEVEKQRLFFSGKLLNDNTPIYKYDVRDGYVVQVILAEEPKENELEKVDKVTKEKKAKKQDEGLQSLSEYYNLEDWVEVKDKDGSYYEAQISEIYEENTNKENEMKDNKGDESNKGNIKGETSIEEGNHEKEETLSKLMNVDQSTLLYKVLYKKGDDEVIKHLKLGEIRPRSIKSIDLSTLKIRQSFHVNYNMKKPTAWGNWHDMKVDEIERRRGRVVAVKGCLTGLTGGDIKEVRLELSQFEHAVFGIRQNVKRTERSPDWDAGSKPICCDRCKQDRTKLCKSCGCAVCGSRREPEKTIVCDECQDGFHLDCLEPPLESVPLLEDWFCAGCRNEDQIVTGAQTVETKRGKVASNSKTKRDWGRGMATAGLSTANTLVPISHFGPIPGVEVGTTWRYRIQVAEAGVHRPPVAGIAGRQNLGAFSIVLGGGYEDDRDDGDEVLYTGSGGRDLSGNKRVSGQSCDQELTRMNLALALNCDTKLQKEGGSAKDWKKGKAVRVVRSYKEKSEFAPSEGFRYDGIYRVVQYSSKQGMSGFKVWQFLLRRDDPSPAPWTKEGKKNMEALGLDRVKYPENYVEREEKAKGKGKRKKEGDEGEEEGSERRKRSKIQAFKLGDLEGKISADSLNASKWSELASFLLEGKLRYLEEVQKAFECACCQELAAKPITLSCKHTFCSACLKRARAATGDQCVLCKTPLEKTLAINPYLEQILSALYPGYEVARG